MSAKGGLVSDFAGKQSRSQYWYTGGRPKPKRVETENKIKETDSPKICQPLHVCRLKAALYVILLASCPEVNIGKGGGQN
jgi:hypothetical protein